MIALGKIFALLISLLVIFVIFILSVAIISVTFSDDEDIFYEYECEEMDRKTKGKYDGKGSKRPDGRKKK